MLRSLALLALLVQGPTTAPAVDPPALPAAPGAVVAPFAPSREQGTRALPAPPDRALDAIRPAAVRADVDFLASPLLRGRATPSAGLDHAAQYLRVRVERIGLDPGARGAWFHEYELERTALSEASRLTLEAADARFDLRPLDGFLWTSATTDSERRAGDAVVVGDAGRAALASLTDGALEGRWALATTRPERLQSTRRRLRDAGALGLVLVPTVDDESADEDERDARAGARRRTERWLEGRLSQPRPSDANDPDEDGGEVNADEPPIGESSDDEDDRPSRRRFERRSLPFLELTPRRARELASAVDLDAPVGTALALRIEEDRVVETAPVPARNLCAVLPGTDPVARDEWIVCGAHYDHVGMQGGALHPGADDNASGTAGLLAVAEALHAAGPRPRTVLFVWFSAEENGLWGSEAFCRDLPLPEGARVVANLNLDMIGRTEPGELYVTPTRDHAAFSPFADLAYRACAVEGFAELRSQDEYFSASDHASFASVLGVPVAFLSTGDHPDYHEPTDTADKLDEDKIARVARLATRVVFAAADASFELEADGEREGGDGE